MNLPATTRVIIVEFGWNPTQDDQAIARAYRYGQTKPTFVYRLFAHKTFESRLVAANIHKTNLFAKVIDDQNHSKTVSKGDLKNYFILPADVAQSQLPADFVTSDTLLDGCVQK